MARIKDLETVCKMVVEAFEHPTGKVVVARGERFGLELRAQLNIHGVHQSDICRAVNRLVANGTLIRTDDEVVYHWGSGPDPILKPAAHIRLADPAAA